jgi:hypothetical protein
MRCDVLDKFIGLCSPKYKVPLRTDPWELQATTWKSGLYVHTFRGDRGLGGASKWSLTDSPDGIGPE